MLLACLYHRCGVFIEEGASDNIITDNYLYNNTFGIGFYTNLGGKDPGRYPTKDNWVGGFVVLSNKTLYKGLIRSS